MDLEQEDNKKISKSNEKLVYQLGSLFKSSTFESIVGWYIVLNLIVLYCRPQDLIGVLASIHFPVLFSLPLFFLWIARMKSTWTRQSKLMILFLIFEATRIVFGKIIIDSFVLNDFWAFQTWRSLTQLFLCYLFPIIVYMMSANQLKKLSKAFILIGALLGTYAILQGGVGPGGFVEDENDLCLILLSILPFPILLIPALRSWSFKILGSLALVLILGGIVMTKSRGGFVGLLCTSAYLFYRSPNKVLLCTLGVIFIVSAIPFVPDKYWDEMKTISTKAGTAVERIESWKISVKIWSTPKHMLQGVGLENTPWWIERYQSADRGITKKSLAGRTVHSTFFQVLSDLGLIGIALYSFLALLSYTRNKKGAKEASRLLEILDRFNNFAANTKKKLREEERTLNDPELERSIKALGATSAELVFLRALFISINVSWIAVATAGFFISVAYYPPFWLLATLSATAQMYWLRLQPTVKTLLNNSSDDLREYVG